MYAIRSYYGLTKRDAEQYEAFIERVDRNALARRVKIADLEDNLKLGRIPHPTARDRLRMRQYETAHARLTVITSYSIHYTKLYENAAAFDDALVLPPALKQRDT